LVILKRPTSNSCTLLLNVIGKGVPFEHGAGGSKPPYPLKKAKRSHKASKSLIDSVDYDFSIRGVTMRCFTVMSLSYLRKTGVLEALSGVTFDN